MRDRKLSVRGSLDHSGCVRIPRPVSLPSRPLGRQALLDSGVTPRMLRTQLAAGRLITVRHGVYLSADHWPEDVARQHILRARAETVIHPDAVISHQSAALIWNLPTPGFGAWHDLPPAITLPPAGHRSRAGAAVHRRSSFASGEMQEDDEGYPVTSPARTAVDLALDQELPGALVLLDAAARVIIGTMVADPRRQQYGAESLVGAARGLFTQSAESRRRGRQLADAITALDALRESPAESLSAGHMILAALPLPVCQAEIRTAAGRFYPDFYWDRVRLIGECDGAVKYREASGYVAEKDREQVLRDLGYRFVRWQAKEIMLEPQRVIERIARALGV